LSITLNQTFSALPTFQAWVDNTDDDNLSPDFMRVGQMGGATAVELSADGKTATVKSAWRPQFSLTNFGYNALFVRVYDANNDRLNLLNIHNKQGLKVLTIDGYEWATELTASV
jgi:hypothetical protein